MGGEAGDHHQRIESLRHACGLLLLLLLLLVSCMPHVAGGAARRGGELQQQRQEERRNLLVNRTGRGTAAAVATWGCGECMWSCMCGVYDQPCGFGSG